MNSETYTTFDNSTLDEITSAVCARLEGSRILLEEAGPAGDAFEGIIDDATDKLTHLQKLSREYDWSKAQPGGAEQASEPPLTDRQRTARLTDVADETEAGIRELLAALNMAEMGETDAETGRYAVRAFAKLARAAHERAREAARMAEELHEGNGRDRAA